MHNISAFLCSFHFCKAVVVEIGTVCAGAAFIYHILGRYHLGWLANLVCFILENGKFISPYAISSFHIFICSVWILQRDDGLYVLFIPFAPNSMAHDTPNKNKRVFALTKQKNDEQKKKLYINS